VASKQPAVVAGLGRPETPEETQARLAKARQERRGRQTIRNLVGSLLASLAVVALLVFVVARPDSSLVEEVDWRGLAGQAADQVPGTLVVPDLSGEWSANRAEISSAPGAVVVWSVGFVSQTQGFVFLDQGFDADSSWIQARTRQARQTAELTLGADSGPGLEWIEYDRRAQDPSGNYAYILVHLGDSSTIVVGGTSADAVAEVARVVTESLRKETRP